MLGSNSPNFVHFFKSIYDAPKPEGPYTQIPCCDTSKFRGSVDNSSTRRIFVVEFLYIFLTNIQILIIFYKSLMYNSFTCQSILKLNCSNIFYKNTSQGHNSAFFVLTVSKERCLLVYLKGWPTKVSRYISYQGYSPPKCNMQCQYIQSHAFKYLYSDVLECLHVTNAVCPS